MHKRFIWAFLVVVMACLMAMPVFAQDGTEEPAGGEDAGGPPMELPPLPEGAEVVAENLNYPRLFTVADDGTIYLALVGPGGDVIVSTPEGDVPFGMSSSVVAVGADGAVEPLVSSLPSAAGIGGAAAVALTDDAVWVVVNGPGPDAVPALLMASALRFDRETGHLADYVDLFGYELENDPDGNGLDTNPTDVAVADDGTLFLLDAGANALYTWTADGGVETFAVWPDNPVPTAVAVADDDSLYVSFLGTEIAPGAGKVEHLSADGELLETFSGYNALTDIAIAADGSVYVASLLSGFGEMGPLPGQVLAVTGDGGEVVVDGLLLPYGLGFDADGSLLVSTGASFLPPESGMLLRFPAPGM